MTHRSEHVTLALVCPLERLQYHQDEAASSRTASETGTLCPIAPALLPPFPLSKRIVREKCTSCHAHTSGAWRHSPPRSLLKAPLSPRLRRATYAIHPCRLLTPPPANQRRLLKPSAWCRAVGGLATRRSYSAGGGCLCWVIAVATIQIANRAGGWCHWCEIRGGLAAAYSR